MNEPPFKLPLRIEHDVFTMRQTGETGPLISLVDADGELIARNNDEDDFAEEAFEYIIEAVNAYAKQPSAG